MDYSVTPYHYSHNNPISAIDPSGYTDYIYTSNTDYYVENEDHWLLDPFIPDKYYAEKDGKRYETNSKETATETDWKDIWTDWEKDKNGFEKKVEDATAGVDKWNPVDVIYHAVTQSPEKGDLDQKHNLVKKDNKEASKSKLYVFDGKAYNWREAGNVVWGYSMAMLGFPIGAMVPAAHLYSLIRNQTFDQPNGVKAFKAGYYKAWKIFNFFK